MYWGLFSDGKLKADAENLSCTKPNLPKKRKKGKLFQYEAHKTIPRVTRRPIFPGTVLHVLLVSYFIFLKMSLLLSDRVSLLSHGNSQIKGSQSRHSIFWRPKLPFKSQITIVKAGSDASVNDRDHLWSPFFHCSQRQCRHYTAYAYKKKNMWMLHWVSANLLWSKVVNLIKCMQVKGFFGKLVSLRNWSRNCRLWSEIFFCSHQIWGYNTQIQYIGLHMCW